ncbi:mechanosensitive ion channel family protein [uncultured Roseivirga sp.]|uniref:mechanosensitive ion channel family protein n=1 Tax=uncultured Roseivirga sp. TaxID=543088 RepID=UPI000D7B2EB2|nr:mechanosensitive ion channel family protein [uncultured Roseivirga sp.]PWL31205.1 MAG: mechanosensitive ion channel protein MscS [Roseivirga sp. XM-24bin3]
MNEKLQIAFDNFWSNVLENAPSILIGFGLLIIFTLIGYGLQSFIKRRLIKRLNDQLLTNFIARIVFLIFLIIGLTSFLNEVGWSKAASSLLAGAGVSALIIGFAFKDIGENFLAGFFLAFSRPFSIGDIIEIEGMTGTVRALNFRSTHVRTFDGRDVFVPNASLIKNMLTNFTRDGLMRHNFIIGIDYGDDLVKANKVVLDELSKLNGLVQAEGMEPFVVIQEFGTSTINLNIHFWTNSHDFEGSVLQLKSEVMRLTVDRLTKEGFSMPADIVELKIYKPEYAIPVTVSGKIEQDNLKGKV